MTEKTDQRVKLVKEDWRAGLKVKDILLGIQDLLANPNNKSPAQKVTYPAVSKAS